jgi:hypothetical protein
MTVTKKIALIFIFVLGILVRTKAQNPVCLNAYQNINKDSLILSLEELVGRKFVVIDGIQTKIQSRYAYHADNALAAKYITNKFAAWGYSIRNMNFGSSGQNVIAEKKGTQFPNKSIMLCAHYDCVGGKFTQSQGADDNASGVAALLEAARVLKDIDFPYSIQFAFWDEEEIGLLGSKAFPSWGGGLPELLTVINLDMIAWDGNNDSLAMAHVTPSLSKSIEFADRLYYLIGKYKLPLKLLIKNPGEPNTDHQTFWNRDIPAIGLTEDYDNDFNPHWHLYSDSIENIHQNYFLSMSKLAIVTLCEFSFEGLTGLEKNKLIQSFQVFPNPTNNKITLTAPNLKDDIVLKLSDLTGQEFLLQTLYKGDVIEINLPSYISPGVYFLSIFGSNQQTLPIKILVE